MAKRRARLVGGFCGATLSESTTAVVSARDCSASCSLLWVSALSARARVVDVWEQPENARIETTKSTEIAEAERSRFKRAVRDDREVGREGGREERGGRSPGEDARRCTRDGCAPRENGFGSFIVLRRRREMAMA